MRTPTRAANSTEGAAAQRTSSPAENQRTDKIATNQANILADLASRSVAGGEREGTGVPRRNHAPPRRDPRVSCREKAVSRVRATRPCVEKGLSHHEKALSVERKASSWDGGACPRARTASHRDKKPRSGDEATAPRERTGRSPRGAAPSSVRKGPSQDEEAFPHDEEALPRDENAPASARKRRMRNGEREWE